MDRLTTFLALILALTALITRGEGRGLEEHVGRLGRLEAERSNLSSQFDALEQDHNKLNNLVTNNEQQGQLTDLRLTNTVQNQCSAARVAFTVGLTGTGSAHVSGIVKYNHVIYNSGTHGGVYSTATGKFTSPVAGLYSFSVSVLAGEVGSTFKGACIYVMVNGTPVTVTGAYDPDWRAATSTSAVIHLRVGDTLYVEACPSPDGYMLLFGTPFNVFTGHLVSADGCL